MVCGGSTPPSPRWKGVKGERCWPSRTVWLPPPQIFPAKFSMSWTPTQGPDLVLTTVSLTPGLFDSIKHIILFKKRFIFFGKLWIRSQVFPTAWGVPQGVTSSIFIFVKFVAGGIKSFGQNRAKNILGRVLAVIHTPSAAIHILFFHCTLFAGRWASSNQKQAAHPKTCLHISVLLQEGISSLLHLCGLVVSPPLQRKAEREWCCLHPDSGDQSATSSYPTHSWPREEVCWNILHIFCVVIICHVLLSSLWPQFPEDH